MRFKVGDKVIIKSFSQRPKHWNHDGEMDTWMGKTVTIRKYYKSFSNLYSIEEDNGCWEWKESDFLPIPQPGDKVKFRTWEDMEKQYGVDSDGDIRTVAPGCYFPKEVKKYCGEVLTVQDTSERSIKVYINKEIYYLAFSVIEEVLEREMKFTKDMLKSGEHVVEYRDGHRSLYLNGYFVGINSYNDSFYYSDNLENTRFESLDIVAVYKAQKDTSFTGILNSPKELIWKKYEKPIEISLSEAFARLKEIYGQDVKILDDQK